MKPLVLVVIPLRLGSTRLKNKIRLEIGGQSLAQRTVGRAREIFRGRSDVRVVAAVDDAWTERHLREAFADLTVVVTDPALPSGTDRVAAAVGLVVPTLASQGFSVRGVVNLQGDIPFAGASGLRNVAEYFLQSNDEQLRADGMVTLSRVWPQDQDYADAAAVKVLRSRAGFALYFSRFPIPHSKIAPRVAAKNGDLVGELHIGVYGYTPAVLGQICAHAPVALELAEGLEQLRAQWLGIRILVIPTESDAGESYRGIDTAGDLKWARAFASAPKAAKKSAKKRAAPQARRKTPKRR